MKLGFIGLGRMGFNMVKHLLSEGHEVVAFDISQERVSEVAALGALASDSIQGVARRLAHSRTIWIMVPAGSPVDEVIEALLPELEAGDILVDGGNSLYKDSIRRADTLRAKGIRFLDVGTSGGLVGAAEGASLTIGGEEEAVRALRPIFESLSAPGGYAHVGPNGSGHFVKTIHNGIEYAMLEAYGEGFELLRSSPFSLDLEAISGVWQNGSVIRSWMLELAIEAFRKDADLHEISGEVGGGETGEWAVESSIESKTPAPLMYLALSMRYRSREEQAFAGKVIAALRNEFGGHSTGKKAA